MKKKQKHKKYSPKFKESVILDMREHYLSHRETVRKHWGTKTRAEEEKYLTTLRKWERIYITEGIEELMKERRGRRKNSEEERKAIMSDETEKTKEELIVENRRLRMEIEYIKKLSALVLAEERKSGKKRK
ncbi:MAG: hypothetical protein IKG80_05315 [Clostridia bacterium]|nr:hypothetical protein [Clostridia bacterium]